MRYTIFGSSGTLPGFSSSDPLRFSGNAGITLFEHPPLKRGVDRPLYAGAKNPETFGDVHPSEPGCFFYRGGGSGHDRRGVSQGLDLRIQLFAVAKW
jgi:hypothetical protein